MSDGSELNHDSELASGLERADRKRKHADLETPNVSKKRSCCAGVGDLPDELLVEIFTKLPKQDVFCSVRNVCTRWRYLVLDRKLRCERIDADLDNINCHTVLGWISACPFVNHLVLKYWSDVNETLIEGIGHCKHVETVKIVVEHSLYSSRKWIAFGRLLCKLIERCPKLKYLELKGTLFSDRHAYYASRRFRLLLRTCKENIQDGRVTVKLRWRDDDLNNVYVLAIVLI